MAYPMIVTLALEETARSYFNNLRREHFPAHSNYLEAHLTLFYRLPSDEPAIGDILQSLGPSVPLWLDVTDVVCFGTGVAFSLAGEPLLALHRQLQQAFDPWLIRQDRQPLRPHITIQNKVTAFKAQRLQQELKATFVPFPVRATGWATWLYLGGPWKPLASYPFPGAAGTEPEALLV